MTNKENHNHIGRIAINPTRLALLAILAFSAISPTYATINCAGFLPSRYFERIENNKPFAGKFGIINDKGEVILEPQFDSYRYEADKVWVEKNGKMIDLNTLTILD